MIATERVGYGRIWSNLPLRLKAALCYLLPLPLIALVVFSLNFFGFHRFQALALPAIVLELLAGVWLLETVLHRIQELKAATDRMRQGEPIGELQPHSWEINRVGANLKSIESTQQEQQQAVADRHQEALRQLQAPISGIVEFAEQLFDGKLGPISPEHRECLGDILTNARHLGTAVEQLVVPSPKPAAIRREPVDLEEIAYAARDAIDKRRGIRIDLELDREVGAVAVDAAALRQVLFANLSAAVTAAPEHGRVVLRSVLESVNSIRLEVEFNSPAAVDVAEVQRLVEQQGGHAGIRPAGAHSTVLFATLPRHKAGGEFPARPADARKTAQVRETLSSLGVLPDGRRAVMVVGRRPVAVHTVMAALDALGYAPVWLEDIKFTLQVAAQEQPSAVMVDLESAGPETFETVRRALRSIGMSAPVLGFPGQQIAAAR